MSTGYPTSLDSLTNPTALNFLSSPDHAAQHANANDAVEAIQAKVGIDSSATTTSHDYKLARILTTAQAVSSVKRTGTTVSSATPTPTSDDYDIYTITALAEAATFASPGGTPSNGQTLVIRIKDNGTARTLAWNAIYRAIGITLPTTTTVSKTLYCGFIYNSADSRWDCVAVANES